MLSRCTSNDSRWISLFTLAVILPLRNIEAFCSFRKGFEVVSVRHVVPRQRKRKEERVRRFEEEGND